MLTLIINTASRQHELILCTETEILSHTPWTGKRDEAKTLLPKIEEILQKHSKTLKDLTHLVAVSGPGGFSSLRVGISIANALIYSLKLRSASIKLFDWWKKKLADKNNYLLVSSASGNSVFIEGMGKFEEHAASCRFTKVEELHKNIFDKQTPIYGELMEKHIEKFPHIKKENLSEKTINIPEIMKKMEWKKEGIIEPYYGRKAV